MITTHRNCVSVYDFSLSHGFLLESVAVKKYTMYRCSQGILECLTSHKKSDHSRGMRFSENCMYNRLGFQEFQLSSESSGAKGKVIPKRKHIVLEKLSRKVRVLIVSGVFSGRRKIHGVLSQLSEGRGMGYIITAILGRAGF